MICPVLLDNDIKVCLRQWEKQKVNMVWRCLETCVWTGESIFLLFVLPPPASPPPSFFYFYSLAPSDYKTPLTHPPTQETPHHLCCIFFHKKCMFSIEAEPREAKKILLQKHRTCSLSSNMSLLVVQMKNGWSSCTLVAAVVPYTSMNSLQKCMEAGD